MKLQPLCLPLALAAALPAQADPIPDAQPGSRAAIAQARGAGHDDGVTWAMGYDYKAIFEPGAVVFTPALGDRAPRSMPLRFTLEAVRRGPTTVFNAAATHATAWQVDGHRVFADHGHGLVERYDAAADHLKQSFVFAEPPSGSGDLVVRMRLDTELRADAGENLDGLELRSEFGGVDIGQVVGIDANGQRATGTMRYDGSHLELRLDDAFVRTAAYPLVLDPPIGSTATLSSALVSGVDIAYHTSGLHSLVVWQHRFSATDTDVRGIRVTSNNVVRGSLINIAFSSGNEGSPAVATVRYRDMHFVVFTQERGLLNLRDIRCRTVNMGGGIGPLTDITNNPVVDAEQPDASGDLTGLTDAAFVVYRDPLLGIIGAPVAVDSTGNSTVGSPITIVGNPQAHEPAISKSHGTEYPHQMCCVWLSGGGSTMGIRLLDRTGTPESMVAWNGPSAMGRPLSSPDVDGDGKTFLAVYEEQEGPGVLTKNVWATAAWDADLLNSQSAIIDGGQIEIAGAAGKQEYGPSVCTMFPESWGTPYWLVACTQVPAGLAEVHATSVSGPYPRQCGPWYRVDSAASTFTSGTSIATIYSGGPSSIGNLPLADEAMIAWNDNGASILSRRYSAFEGGTVTQLSGAPGCGAGSGTCGTNSNPTPGNAGFAITLTGADPQSFAAFWRADLSGSPLSNSLCGSPCERIDGQIQLFIPPTLGEAEIPVALPCSNSFVGFTFDSQWIVISNQGTGCAGAPNLHFSNAIRVVLGL
ncbi:MAG: hypothetical protein NXI31_02890 [bacterium]|nr:hypothetical protein [bacterium]